MCDKIIVIEIIKLGFKIKSKKSAHKILKYVNKISLKLKVKHHKRNDQIIINIII